MRTLYLLVLLPALALAQGYQPLRANAPNAAVSVKSVTASSGVNAPSIVTNSRGSSGYLMPVTAPALVATPTISVSSTNPAATPTYVPAATGGLSALRPDTSHFAFSGGTYDVPSNTYPYYNAATMFQVLHNPLGSGSAIVDFISDAPAITFTHTLSYVPSTRILVDGVEVWRATPALRAGTAQGGASNSITLDSGASATSGFYVGNWVRTTGGTGSGQSVQVTAYNGSTKVATVQPAWTTAPDATSTFEVTASKVQMSNATQSGWSTYYVTLTWNERRFHHYRMEQLGQAFYGVYVTSAIDTVAPAPKPTGSKCIWIGDSYSEGTGAPFGFIGSLGRIACDDLGLEFVNLSVGGTGYLAPGPPGASLTITQRLVPPTNSWFLKLNDMTAGSYTLTQNGATATIAYNDPLTTIQSKLDAAFGSGTFTALQGSAATENHLWLIGQGVYASFAGAMTADFSGVTSPSTPTITRYLGDLAPNVPVDGSGRPQPFTLVLAGGHNDTTTGNAGYLPSLLQSTVTSLLTTLVAKYPTARIIMIGAMDAHGDGQPMTDADTALLAASTAVLPRINGNVPFVETLSPAWATGSGSLGNPKGDGNKDIVTWTDGVHPSAYGHVMYGHRIAAAIEALSGMP